MDAAVIEMDNSSSALTSLSASLLAKVQFALPSTTKMLSAGGANNSTAASQTLIGETDAAHLEDHGSAANADALIHKLNTFDAKATTASDDLASQHLTTGRPTESSKKRGENVLFADLHPDGMLQSHRTTHFSGNGPQSSNLSKIPANSSHKLRQPQHPKNPYPRRFNVADFVPGELAEYGGADYNGGIDGTTILNYGYIFVAGFTSIEKGMADRVCRQHKYMRAHWNNVI